MKHLAKYSVGAVAIMALAACGQGGSVIKADETAATEQTGEATLANVKASIDAAPDMSVPAIDPAAANIDPFSGYYTAEQRDSFKAQYETIEFSEEQMTTDIEETELLLNSKAATMETGAYVDGLTCAAKFDLAAKQGALPAHEAQMKAKEVLSVTAVGYEGGISPSAAEEEREAIINDYRDQTYRNYLLVRSSIDADMTGDELLAEAQTCYEDFGFQVDVPESETADEDMPAEG